MAIYRFAKTTDKYKIVNGVSPYTEVDGIERYLYFPVVTQSALAEVGITIASSATYTNKVRIGTGGRDALANEWKWTISTEEQIAFDKVSAIFGKYRSIICYRTGTSTNSGLSYTSLRVIRERLHSLFGLTSYDAPGTYSLAAQKVGTTDRYKGFGYIESYNDVNPNDCWWTFYLNCPVQFDNEGSGDNYGYWYLIIEGRGYGGAVQFSLWRVTPDNWHPPLDPRYIEINPNNPYPNVPDSTTGGGDGEGDNTTDTIPSPSVPTISAFGSGLVELYNPTSSQLATFGSWLWGTGFDLSTLKRVFNDPMDMILGLSIFPVSPPITGSTEHIQLGNLTCEDVSCNVLARQYQKYSFGTIDLAEYYGSYLDYAPYTKVQIYLPYIGIRTLNTDEVMKKTIGVSYTIDFLSGACVCHIMVNGSLMYEFGGSCNEAVPLTGRDMSVLVQGIAGMVATGVTAAVGAVGAMSALPATATAEAFGAVGAGFAATAGVGMARQVLGSKPTVEHASGIGGATGLIAWQKPFLIVERPRLCHPPNQEHFTGYPGFLYFTVSQLIGTGYTKFVNFEPVNIHATDAELDEIEDWFVNRGVRL